ncbi:hypothetical protein [Chelatococcus asaccharovorans]|uniref:Uncharacterized protein n=1 Tax=Chelatococcus asaccharovorans TaxID=28210 RepID=A0A2V3UC37_9HYPH|nr:hypothetical protein [Chelatococcus asaccharovorans]MBS7703183.1 hypothetical protein [Chelatococcus asaccharovorans]PXW61512.1 hypothetical protein C7450_10327 [Chelatococcus asaccharovorans]
MSFLSKIFGGGSKRKQSALLFQQQLEAQAAEADRKAMTQELTAAQNRIADQLADQTAVAQQAQQQAEEAALKAAEGPGDSEDARQAAEKKIRKALSAKGLASTILSRGGGDLGAAPVGTRTLLGA